MKVTRLKLTNWRNFLTVDVPLGDRMFIIGPNAAGKSNLLDVFRFLRDVAKTGGGLQQAINDRGGMSKIRCLAGRREGGVGIEVTLVDRTKSAEPWTYSLAFKVKERGDRSPRITHERVTHGDEVLLNRPEVVDEQDDLRLTQTHLEQISANSKFRELARAFSNTQYLHLVPQLVKHPREFSGPGIAGDPFGRAFLENIAKTPEKTRSSRLAKIESALQCAVPQLKQLQHVVDIEEGGVPHLEALYEHWRPNPARQREREFSDGTLRLIGLFWSLLDGKSLLLLEEPELSLHAAIVKRLPELIAKLTKRRGRQVIISTHSSELLSSPGIGGEEILLLRPQPQGTYVSVAADDGDIRQLLEAGLSVAEAALPTTALPSIRQLDLFEEVK